MAYHQTTLKQNDCPVNSLEQNLIFTELRNQRKLPTDLINMIKNIFKKKSQLREPLNISENVLVMAEQIKKKFLRGKFYKQSIQNISCFNKDKVFVIKNKRNIDNKTVFWLDDTKSNKYFNKKFQRHKLFATENNFM